MNIEQAQHLQEIKYRYDLGLTYYKGELNGESFKIRMNKDHGRNSYRNDDQEDHNLSLVSVKDKTVVEFFKSGNKIQWQFDNITDWSDAEEKILGFFYEIENV